MSHEGIRFISEEQARKEQALQRELPREATDPAKVRVHKTEGTGMEIEWKDGHRSAWSFAWLRLACPCATCHEEREQSGRQPGEPKPQPPTLLPMYQAPPRPDAVKPVGRYAISFDWNDGHTSGIYSWDFLRRHCTCEECRSGISSQE
ncbi:gamma-butyrobetaine hydroxylase-like domain-containing protein [Paracidobacterium acidisoli]|uniref:DUF971 domain-containing protein n=1 Tax=Paracidobacterium acidisoli TaxID=2303751 RepID=A0A372IQ98_9BACT|nr:DUF971 domain-containing protein [Paracidobacterium acidisoli]MBT9331398.1 DUF971 domain-containing protein [Paracidobacterium acidisoli]